MIGKYFLLRVREPDKPLIIDKAKILTECTDYDKIMHSELIWLTEFQEHKNVCSHDETFTFCQPYHVKFCALFCECG